MLVLGRRGPLKDKPGESMTIRHGGEELRIVIREVKGQNVWLAFDGPMSFNIVRDEAVNRGDRRCSE